MVCFVDEPGKIGRGVLAGLMRYHLLRPGLQRIGFGIEANSAMRQKRMYWSIVIADRMARLPWRTFTEGVE
jgi:hypothetical protein